MLDKQDATIDVLKSVKEDTSAFGEDISMARKDTKDELYEKYEYLSREITDIKSSLSEINTLLSDTDSHGFIRINELNDIINIFQAEPSTRTHPSRPTEAL